MNPIPTPPESLLRDASVYWGQPGINYIADYDGCYLVELHEPFGGDDESRNRIGNRFAIGYPVSNNSNKAWDGWRCHSHVLDGTHTGDTVSPRALEYFRNILALL